MSRHNDQHQLEPDDLAQWRCRILLADRAIDEAQESLGAMCRRINVADDDTDLTHIAERIQTLLLMCQTIAVEVDEIATFERAHTLISMMQGVLIFIDLRVQGGP